MATINQNIDCKVTYTKWYYMALLYSRIGRNYPDWLKRKTVAWMICGDSVRQVKLMECI